ncbi:pyridoxamine 5-phosphate oxidase [Clostridiales bacterium PH28_bin88]|nr:pyridoxamine 5-phosphate oxidase [Clostridiales bacterium PH28_bin88]
MLLTDEVKELIPKAPIVPVVTVSREGEPHLITVGKVKEVRDEGILVFGIFRMETTQKNLRETGKMQVVIASRENSPKGFRLKGEGRIEGKEVLFQVEKVESLL